MDPEMDFNGKDFSPALHFMCTETFLCLNMYRGSEGGYAET